MSFILKKGRTKFVYLPVTTSTALSAGSLVTASSGLLVAATSSTAAADIQGVLRHAIASTDSDYATARLVEVQVPLDRHTTWTGSVTSGLVAADIGTEVDLTDASTVNRGASSIKAVRVVSVNSTTSGVFYVKINGSY